MSKNNNRFVRQLIRKCHCFRISLLALSFLVMAGFTLTPGAADAQPYTFSSIAIEGNNRVENGTVLSYAQIPRGRTVTQSQLNASYQAVLGSGLFESVEFIPAGSRLLIRVVEYPTINVINVEGNRRIDDEEALAVFQSQPRRVLNPTQVEEDAEALIELYEIQGRLAATVIPKIIARSDNRVDLVFEVTEGRNVEVERLSFVGNRKFSDARLRRVLDTKQAGIFRSIVRRDTFIEDRLEFDRSILQDFYRSRGYVDFQTLSVSSEFSRERNAFFVTFTVREGQSFNIGEVTTISEIPEVDAAEFQAAVKLRPGQTYNPAAIDNSIARLERLALRKGLSFLRVDPRITRNDRDLTLDVEFALVRGPRIFIERIDIEGNTTTLDRVVRRQFKVVEGDPFNPREIREAAERIRALGLFANVEVEARVGSNQDQVIVDTNVAEQPTGSLAFGASYDTEAGVGITASFRERNFLGRGQTLNADVTFGTDSANYQLNFVEPYFLGRDLRFSLRGIYSETEYEYTDYDTRLIELRPAIEFPVSENGKLALSYTLSDDSIFNVDAASSPLLQAEEAEGSLLSSALGYTYSYDTRRGGLNPNRGVVFRFGQEIGGLGGDAQFIKSTAYLSGETRVINDEVVLRATVEGGALNMLDGNSRLNDRFFLNSSKMRGFAPVGLGPRDLTVANEDALGGNYFAVARFETEFPLGLPEEYGIRGGLFADIGSVWGLDDDNGGLVDDDLYLRSSVGFSIFWDTGLGPLRFNFSTALDKESYDEEQTFDLTISTQF